MSVTTTTTTTTTTATTAASAASIVAAADREARRPEEREGLMTAVTQRRYGGPDTLRVEQVARPEIADDEVLIDVVAAGLDRGVEHLMTGEPYLIRLMGYGLTKPANPILGFDVAGRVVQVGDSVTRFAPGDEVMGIAKGSYAEFAAAEEAKLVKKPRNVTFASAAVSTVSGITALQALVDKGSVAAGEQVLVIGASGGVGAFAVQIAKALGATVVGVASAAKSDSVLSLGADNVIEYETTDLGELNQRFDLIIDIGGRNPIRKLRRILAPTGRLVIVGGEDGGRLTGGIGRQLRAMLWSPFVSQKLGFFISDEAGGHVESLAELVSSGQVEPAIGARYSLAETRHAVRHLEAGRALGKTVVVVDALSAEQ